MTDDDELHCPDDKFYHRHRPVLGMAPRSIRSVCRFCGRPIRRAHARSTWWRAEKPSSTEPAAE